jgi:hypothetical protein
VGAQIANQAAKPLKKGEKEKKNHLFWNNRIAGLVVFTSLVSHPVYVSLRHTWSPLVAA